MKRTVVCLARIKHGLRVKESVLFSRSEDKGGPAKEFEGCSKLLYKVTQGSYYAVRVPLLKSGFKRVHKDSLLQCNIIWRRPFSLDSNSEEHEAQGALTDKRQWVNHVPSSYIHLGSKDGMYSAISFMRATYGPAFDITPKTWILPLQHAELQSYTDDNPEEMLISKPARGSCGREITVLKAGDTLLQKLLAYATAPAPPPSIIDGTKVYRHRNWVVQRYITPPLLINSRKFDLRLYVAVTSINPLVVYIYQEGLVRFASEEYEGGNRLAQLTNSSLARKREITLKKNDDTSLPGVNPVDAPPELATPLEPWQTPSRPSDTDPEDPSWPRFKWSISELKTWMQQEKGDAQWDTIWKGTCDAIVKALIAAERPISKHLQEHDKNGVFTNQSFELFGFDVMIDEDLKPWLIEVNCIPSLESSSAMDWAVKCGIMTDLLNMLMVQSFERDPEDMRVRYMIDEVQEMLREEQKKEEEERDPAKLDELAKRIESLVRTLPPAGPPVRHEWDPADFAKRVEEEQRHTGGYECLFPTKEAVSHNREYFSGSPSETRNMELWEKLNLL